MCVSLVESSGSSFDAECRYKPSSEMPCSVRISSDFCIGVDSSIDRLTLSFAGTVTASKYAPPSFSTPSAGASSLRPSVIGCRT
jgi:hypothetical protein